MAVLPSIERFREVFTYDAATGQLFKKPTRKGKLPKLAGSLDGNGYIGMCVDRYRCRAHQVVFAMHHGYWSLDSIDHINGNKSDNRIENLRSCTHPQNLANRKKSGVYETKNGFRAYLSSNGEAHYLGTFVRRADAKAVVSFADVLLNNRFAHGESKDVVWGVYQRATDHA